MADNRGRGKNRKGGRGRGNEPPDEASVGSSQSFQSPDTERVGHGPSASELVVEPDQPSAPADQVVEQLATMTLGSNSEETQSASKNKKKKKKKANTDQGEQSTSAAIETPGPTSASALDVEPPGLRSADQGTTATSKPETGPSEQMISTIETQEPETETQSASKNKKKKKKKAKDDQGEQPPLAAVETPGPSSASAQSVEPPTPRSADPSKQPPKQSPTETPKQEMDPSESKTSTTEMQEPETETQSASKNKKKKKKKAKDDQGEQPPSAAVQTPGPSSTKPPGQPPAKKPASGAGATPGASSSKQQGQPSSSKAPENKPVSGSGERPASAITTIPVRRTQGPISFKSKFFDQTKNYTIEVNYLPIEFTSKDMKIFHYDVEFPERTAKSDFRVLVNEMRRRHFPKRHPAFDGAKNLYAAANPLFKGSAITDTVSIARDNGKTKDYDVTIQLAHHDVDLTIASLYKYIKNGCSMNIPSATIQAVDVAIRGSLYDRFATCGRAFYTLPRQRIDLSAGLELYTGFIQSAVLGRQPYLNVDVSHRGFYTRQSLIDYLRQVIKSRTRHNQDPDYRELKTGLSPGVRETLENYVKQNNGLRVLYTDPRTRAIRRYKLAGLAGKPADVNFEITDGPITRPISVYDYYSTGKQHKIEYPNLPVVKTARGEYLLIELCMVDHKQPVANRYAYSPDETRQMIRNCTDLPRDRKDKILKNIQDAGFNADPIQKEFGITIGSRGNTKGFLQVQAANLLPPTIQYRNGFAPVNNGVWDMKQFYNAVNVTNWIVLNMNERSSNDLNKMIDLLKNDGRAVGVNMNDPLEVLSLRSTYPEPIERMFFDLKRKHRNLELVVVVLPSFDTDVVYRRVKYVSEIKVGILTQCVKPNTVQRMTWMTARNILLKINSKVTGVNHTINYPNNSNQGVLDGSTIFLGADVTHPPPGPRQNEEPSICAVAGSYDRHGWKYKMLYSVQNSKQEMIGSMERMVYELLVFFRDQNEGRLPSKMYYYRDGVSEGQFYQVLDIELRAIKAACARLNANIKVTVLVVQKRHHTRFFPLRDGADKKGNVLAGTVVNTDITHPVEHDFYLVSHQSIQGTARPTKYHVLYDEIQAAEDYVEALTYYLCYMFARCTRSVSYPAPTYYSHLAAERAGRYVKCAREANVDLNTGLIGSGRIHADMVDRNPMYFV